MYVLRKTQGPALAAESLGDIDLVLLSHDHHFDNLDHAGRRVLGTAARVVATVAGAGRLGARAIGLAPWESEEVPAPDGRMLRITATPARPGEWRPGTGDRVLRGAGRRARARGKP